mmetsp:Transcript_84909/g.168565  ORF Transcript_84909/g.168565 Transcript_84909/m.168565 type:complete len:109 (-) Transcript_84909:79-405(-)
MGEALVGRLFFFFCRGGGESRPGEADGDRLFSLLCRGGGESRLGEADGDRRLFSFLCCLLAEAFLRLRLRWLSSLLLRLLFAILRLFLWLPAGGEEERADRRLRRERR